MTIDEFRKRQHTIKKVHHEHPEDEIQKECVRWFRRHYPDIAPLLFHPNNEPYFGGWGKTEDQKMRDGARAKAMGVTPGVADLVLLLPEYWPMKLSPHCTVLCIEVKSKVGRQRDNQKAWQKVAEDHGAKYVIVRSVAEFKKVVMTYLTQKPMSDEEAARREFLELQR